MRRLAAAIVVLCCTPSSALADDVVEISLGAGIHKLSSTQDLGDYAQLANVRSGIVGTTLAAFDLRAQYCIGQRLCLGPPVMPPAAHGPRHCRGCTPRPGPWAA